MSKLTFTMLFAALTYCAMAQELRVTPNVPRGLIQGRTVVTLTPPPGATIRYTTNLTNPSRTAGQIYTQPIVITGSTVIKTFAYTATTQSKVESFTYINPVKGPELRFPNHVTAADYANGLRLLPIVSISVPPTSGLPFDSKTEQAGTFEYINKAGENASIGVLAGVEGYGSDSYINSEQRNLRISFKNVYGYSELSYPIFARDEADTRNPTTKFDVLELKIGQDGPNADGFGMVMSSQSLISKTMREMGNVDVHTKYVHAFVNGKYHGVYTLKEKYDNHFAASYYGGSSKEYDEIEGGWRGPALKVKPDGTSSSTLNTWRALETALAQRNYTNVKKYLNVSQFIDFMILIMYFDNEWEFRALADKTLVKTKLVFQDYDTDGALVKLSDDNEFVYNLKWSDPAKKVFNGPAGLFGDLIRLNNPEFKALLRERVQNAFQKPNAPLSAARVRQKLEALKAEVRPVFGMELARFNRTFYNDNPYFDEEYNLNLRHLPTRAQYNLNKWLGVLAAPAFAGEEEIVDNQAFVISPNPIQDYATLDLSTVKGQKVEFKIFNILGALVKQETIEVANVLHRFSVNGLERGTYIVTIQTESQGTVSRKLLVAPE
jgi:CotH kinase protein/Secretion system C-terminal sorting domain/Fn3 associated